MAAKPSKDKTENWTQDFSTYFWSSSAPFEAKFEMEKTMGLLLAGGTAQMAQLTYSGSDNPPYTAREVQLRFEAALPDGNWYSLRVTAWVPRAWYTETEFRGYADRAFGYWIRNLKTAPTPGLLTPPLGSYTTNGSTRRWTRKRDERTRERTLRLS